ncbi:MAG TPA: prolyl oligopeptidase family serine peptidase [Polyangiaceae bacterium]|nr:prolyl oligopeptidase family serine peptidase [Polyangiaceae bacterium]
MSGPPRLAFALLLAASCQGGGPPAPAGPAPAPAPVESAPAPAAEGPPRAPVRPVTDAYFGVNVVDPYRWMEDPDSAELPEWMGEQSNHARAYFRRVARRDALAKRLRELDARGDEIESFGVVQNRLFYVKRAAGGGAGLYVREGPAGPERLLFDPASEAAPGARVSIDLWAASPDGAHVAVGTSAGGPGAGAVRVLAVATGAFLPDRIDRVNFANFGIVTWLDARRFFVGRTAKPEPGASGGAEGVRVHLHTLGADPEREPPFFGRGVNPRVALDEGWAPVVEVVAGVPYVFATVRRAPDPQMSLYVAPVSQIGGAADKVPWRKAADYDDQITDFAARGDELYLVTHKGAPRSKVVRTSLSRPDLASAATAIGPGERVVRWLFAAKDALYVHSTERGLARVSRLAWGQAKPADLPLAVEGSVRFAGNDPRRAGLYFWQTSWLSRQRLYRHEGGASPPADAGLAPPVAGDLSAFEAVEVEATSADGARVPLSIVARKGLRRDGSATAFLEGYGAYNNALDPLFRPHNVALFERAVYAVCHARGGGELGRGWHEQGRRQNKHHTWEDFIACAEYLAANQYSAPGKIVATGYSAGVLCAGNAVVRRPDLFGAVVLRHGGPNPLRSAAASPSPAFAAELGTPATKEGFEALYAMDVYHQVRDGVRYPAALLIVGSSDARTASWGMTKLAARLQAAGAGGRPVLLRVERSGGAGASPAADEFADAIAFGLAETNAAPD